MSSNGKGHNRRPMQVDQETFDGNWANTFGKKEVKTGQHSPDCERDLMHEVWDCAPDCRKNEKQPDCAEVKPFDTLEDK